MNIQLFRTLIKMTDKESLRRLMTWGVAMAIFFIIALFSLKAMFTPVTIYTEYPDGRSTARQYSALTIPGAWYMTKSWERYPDYTIGLGVSVFFSFCGAGFCIYNIYRTKAK